MEFNTFSDFPFSSTASASTVNPEDLMDDNSPLGGDPIMTSSSPIFHGNQLSNHKGMDFDEDMMQ